MVIEEQEGLEKDSLTDDMPRIEFPCLYPIKIIGVASADFQESVVSVVERHTGKISDELIKERVSRKSNYLSITITIAATGEEQLQHIFEDLKALDSIKMVL